MMQKSFNMVEHLAESTRNLAESMQNLVESMKNLVEIISAKSSRNTENGQKHAKSSGNTENSRKSCGVKQNVGEMPRMSICGIYQKSCETRQKWKNMSSSSSVRMCKYVDNN